MRGGYRQAARAKWIVFGLLIVYVAVLTFQNQKSRTPFAEVQRRVLEEADLGGLQQGGGQDFKRFYGLNEKDYDGLCFYYTNQSMGVEEILLAASEDSGKLEELQRAAEERIRVQLKNFEGYGEEQTRLLQDAVLVKKGSYFLMAVSPSAEEIKHQFLKNV